MDPHFCSKCGAKILDEQPGTCPQCGSDTSTSSNAKEPVLAGALSLVIPGLGQSYNGDALKGIGIFIGILLLFFLNFLLRSYWYFSNIPFDGVLLLLWVIGVYDAYRDAGRMNRGEIPEKKHQMVLFIGLAIVALIISFMVFIIGLIIILMP
jgi:TM2 domain-containing membrane protein YozV